MRRQRHTAAPSVEHAAGDKAPFKNSITEVRRDQNRRAQRAFRERRRVKKRSPRCTAPRLLAPHPRRENSALTVWSVDNDTLDRRRRNSSHDGSTPSTSGQVSADGLPCHRKPSSPNTKEAPFMFSSPQTLFPDHKSLVPRRHSPYSDLLKSMRDSPRLALLPHGVTATLAACLFNSHALGIDIDQIMDPHYMSPFYRASLSTIHSPGSPVQPTTLDVVPDAHLAGLGPLRPCFAQVIFPHHACIDLLPLPRLRETALMLNVRAQQEESSVMSPGFDGVQELKKDVYVRQGVRFRGMGELRGEEYVVYGDGGRHCGQPWESGSWAVALWFARKWRYLVDI